MQPTNANEPLGTNDPAPNSASSSPVVTTDHATTTQPEDRAVTAEYVGARETEPASMDAGRGVKSVIVPGYQIESVLGRGGMGVVYKARHLTLKRTVALKMMLGGGLAGPGDLARFRIEAEAVARLQHANIVQIHEVGETNGHPYCALEFVEGGNLASKINGKPMSPHEAAKLVQTLARAMQLAHSRNVVHRDLKPANILLTADGTPKITDFGLARRTDTDSGETQAGSVMGTPSYMAPEQASGRTHEAGPAADVYALGAILYDCLTGRPPFTGNSVYETLEYVRTQEPTAPSRLQANVPLDLETICLKCLRKEPENRYTSAAELADELVRFQLGEPIRARPVGQLERGWRWCRRHPAAAALIAAITLLLLSVTTFSLVLAERERQTADDLQNINNDLIKEQKEKDVALKSARVAAARLALDRGLILCDQGDASRGLVALTRALAAAMEAGDEDLESAVRFNLAAWERQIWRLRAALSPPDGVRVINAALNAEGTLVAVALTNQTVQLWSAAEGKEGQLQHVLSHAEGANVRGIDVHFSADARLLMTRTEKAVHLWNVATGKPVFAPLRHKNMVTAAALDPAGKFLLTGDEKGSARLWDAQNGQELGDGFQHKLGVAVMAFGMNGAHAFSASRDGVVQVWDVAAMQAVGPSFPLKSTITAARISNDGKSLFVGNSTGLVQRLDMATGKPMYPPLAHDGPIAELALGSDDSILAVRTAQRSVSASARLWHAVTGVPITQPLAHAGDVHAFAFSPDGKTLLTGGAGGSVRRWDTNRGVAVGSPAYHPWEVKTLAFSQDGRTLMTSDGTVRLWRAPRGYRRATLEHGADVYAVAFSRDGQFTLTGGNLKNVAAGSARIWHTATGEPGAESLKTGAAVLAVAFSPDNKLALTAGGAKAHLWQTATGKLQAVLEGHQLGIAAVAFSPDGALVLTGSFDGAARLWNVATAKPVGEPLMHGGPVQAVAFSSDGQRILTGSDDKSARLWCVPALQPIGEPMLHAHRVESVTFSHDSKTAYTACRYDNEVLCWDATTGKAATKLAGHQGGVWSLAVTPRLLLSGSADKTARFWTTSAAEPIGLPLQHQDLVRDVAFGPDGQSALTGSYDGTARRWHAPSGIPIGPPFVHRGKIRAVALSQDGRTAGTASWDGTAALWEAPPPMIGTPYQMSIWAQVMTGINLDDDGAVRSLDAAAWQQLRSRLAKQQ